MVRRGVVGGGEDREVGAGAAAAVAVEAVEAERRIAVVADAGGRDADVREAERAAGAAHRPRADLAAGRRPDDARDVRARGLVAGVDGVDRDGHVETVVAALQVDHDEALLHRVRLGDGRLEDLAPVEPRRGVDRGDADDALGEQPPAAQLARCSCPSGSPSSAEAGIARRLRRDRREVGTRAAAAVVVVDDRLQVRLGYALVRSSHHLGVGTGEHQGAEHLLALQSLCGLLGGHPGRGGQDLIARARGEPRRVDRGVGAIERGLRRLAGDVVDLRAGRHELGHEAPARERGVRVQPREPALPARDVRREVRRLAHRVEVVGRRSSR